MSIIYPLIFHYLKARFPAKALCRQLPTRFWRLEAAESVCWRLEAAGVGVRWFVGRVLEYFCIHGIAATGICTGCV